MHLTYTFYSFLAEVGVVVVGWGFLRTILIPRNQARCGYPLVYFSKVVPGNPAELYWLSVLAY